MYTSCTAAGVPLYHPASALTTRNVSSRSFSASEPQPVAMRATAAPANAARTRTERESTVMAVVSDKARSNRHADGRAGLQGLRSDRRTEAMVPRRLQQPLA